MGLFGGGNSKKSTTNNYDQRALNAAGNSGQAVMGEGNEVTVTYSDHGAVNRAFDFGTAAVEAMQESTGMALGFESDALERGFDFGSQALDYSERITDRAFAESAASRAEAFSTITETNKRVDEFYKTSGRETAEDSMQIVKIMALLVGAGLLVGVVRRA